MSYVPGASIFFSPGSSYTTLLGNAIVLFWVFILSQMDRSREVAVSVS